MDDRLKDLGQRYGGNFAGNGVATSPTKTNANVPRAQFDPKTTQHYTFDSNGAPKLIEPPRQSQGFFDKVNDVAAQGRRLVGQGATNAGRFVVNTAKDIGSAALGVARTYSDVRTQPMQLRTAERLNSQLDATQEQLTRAYGAGKISKDDYAEKLRGLADARTKINKDLVDPIISGPTPIMRAQEIAETAVNALTLGRFQSIKAVTAKAAGKGFVLLNKPPARQGLEKTLFGAGQKVENALQTIPAFRELVARNSTLLVDQSIKQLAGESASQFLTRNAKNVAIGLLIKRPIVYQSNVGAAQDIYNDILTGDYNQAVKDAAWVGAQAVGGGPLGWVARNTKQFAGKIRLLANGKGSFIDELSKLHGDSSPAQIANHLSALQASGKPEDFARAEKILRIGQEVNLQMSGEDPRRAAQAVIDHYVQHGIDPATLTPQRIIDDLDRWAQADEIARKLSPKDSPVEYVAVRWDQAAKHGLANRIEQAGDDFKAMADALSDMASQPGVGWANNPILMAKIAQAISQADSAASAAKAIREIPTAAAQVGGISKAAAKRLAKLGYTLAEPFGGRKTPKVDFKDTRKLVSAVSNGSDIFDEAVAPQPALEGLAGLLRRFGLSPESNTQVAYDKLSEAMVNNLDGSVARELGLEGEDVSKGGKFILSRLQQFINDQKPNPYLNVGTLGRGQQSALQDIRQMSVKEVQEALPGTTRQAAKALQRAIGKAYTDVPLEFRGLGIKAFDYAYRIPGANIYYRIQSALRYTYNPFFRLQEVIETKTLSHLKANNLVWMKPKAELDRVARVLDDSGIFTAGYTGEATQDLTVGRIHANLLKVQKRDLAGLAADIAEKRGITVERMVRDHPEELADALRVIVQYPTKGVLNSSLARTLNVAFFPMRYNLKVAGLAAKEITKLPPTVQTAVIHSIFKTHDWLESPEGIQWQSDNADAIQLFKYFSVYGNIETVLDLLYGKPDSVGSIGQLGGLPFGVISQMLDSQGIIHLNTPYLDKKTGNVLPEYIPETTKAQAAVALQALLNSMFTYPGRIIGLPGKGAFLRDQVGLFLKTGNDDYLKQIRTEDLTPLQQKWIRVLSDPNIPQEEIDKLYTSPAPGQFNGYTLPPMNLPQPVKVLTHAEVTQLKGSQGTPNATKKKALPIPAR